MNPARTEAVLVGASQRTIREPDIDDPVPPCDLTVEVIREALADAGVPAAAVDTIVTIPIHGWDSPNQSAAIAAAMGASPSRTVRVVNGGEAGIRAVNWLARELIDGRSRVAVLAGANLRRTAELGQRIGRTITWADTGPADPPDQLGEITVGHNEREIAAGLDAPPCVYPLFDNALRAAHDRSLEEHLEVVGRLFSRFSAVAARNPHAWYPIERSAAELTTVSPTNRMVAYPYTKYLNAILNTDQAAALILVSTEAADDLGIAQDRRAHWRGGHEADEVAWYPSTRPDFAAAPGMRDAHTGALAAAGVGIDDIKYLDFYSCFPAPVQMAADMLDLSLDDPRDFTLTGGLPYAGGPGSAYTLHSLAAMLDRLRADPDELAFVTGNGWYATKHAASVWSGRPGGGNRGVQSRDTRNDLATAPRSVSDCEGEGTIETYTVVFDRSGAPAKGIVIGSVATGERFIAHTPSDSGLLAEFVGAERIGTVGEVVAGNGVATFHPR